MKTETKHTPTPWRTDKVYRTLIQGISGESLIEIASTDCGNLNDDAYDWDIKERNKNNADFIVRAVNRDYAFEELLEAAKLAFELSPMSSSDKFSKSLNALQGAIRKAEAAQ